MAICRVKLETFEGPLDLLLHLVKKNEIDILDLDIAQITSQYLEYIEKIKELHLDVAGDYLLMASTLIHMKTASLLPGENVQEEEDDEAQSIYEKKDVLKRLSEYKKFKEAADFLDLMEQLDRDVFIRPHDSEEDFTEELTRATIFDLVDAFSKLLEKATKTSDMVIDADEESVQDTIERIIKILREKKTVRFGQLFRHPSDRREIILVFLALLELIRIGSIFIMQAAAYDEIYIFTREKQADK